MTQQRVVEAQVPPAPTPHTDCSVKDTWTAGGSREPAAGFALSTLRAFC